MIRRRSGPVRTLRARRHRRRCRCKCSRPRLHRMHRAVRQRLQTGNRGLSRRHSGRDRLPHRSRRKALPNGRWRKGAARRRRHSPALLVHQCRAPTDYPPAARLVLQLAQSYTRPAPLVTPAAWRRRPAPCPAAQRCHRRHARRDSYRWRLRGAVPSHRRAPPPVPSATGALRWRRIQVVLADLARRWNIVGIEAVLTRPISGVSMDTFGVEDLLCGRHDFVDGRRGCLRRISIAPRLDRLDFR